MKKTILHLIGLDEVQSTFVKIKENKPLTAEMVNLIFKNLIKMTFIICGAVLIFKILRMVEPRALPLVIIFTLGFAIFIILFLKNIS